MKKISLSIFLILLFTVYTNKPLKAEITGFKNAFDKIVGGVTQGTQNNNVQGSLLKKYGATSDITFYFFDASANYLQALEFLHRAYELNTEADKIKASLNYLKNSKSSETDRLKSTTKIIESSSVQIQSSIQDDSYTLNEIGRGYYEQAIPFAMLAGLSTYNFYRSAAATVQNLKSGNSGIESLLMNANNVVAIAKTLPELRGFIFNMQKTIKLILTGAKEKKIGDKNNVNKALNQLNLSDFDEPASFDVKKEEPKLIVKKEEPKNTVTNTDSENLTDLYNSGVLTKEEFEKAKKLIQKTEKVEVKKEEPKLIVKKEEAKVVAKKKEPENTVANADLERLLDLYNSGALTKEEFDLLTKNKKIERLTKLYKSGAITKEEFDLLVKKTEKVEVKKEEPKLVVKKEEAKVVAKKKVVVKKEEAKVVAKKKVVVKKEEPKTVVKKEESKNTVANTDLENLTHLYNSGVLTKEEFDQAKKLIQKTEKVEVKKEEPKLIVKKEEPIQLPACKIKLDISDQHLIAPGMKAYFFYIGPQKNALKRRLSVKTYKKVPANEAEKQILLNIMHWNLTDETNKVRISKTLYLKLKNVGSSWSTAQQNPRAAKNLFKLRKSFYEKRKDTILDDVIKEYAENTNQQSKEISFLEYFLHNCSLR